VEEDLKVRLNSLNRAIEEALARRTTSTVAISMNEHRRSGSISSSAEPDHRYAVIFVFLWVAVLASSVVYTSLSRSRVADLIRNTAEYRCVAAASAKEPTLRWSGFRHLKANDPRFGSYTVGTLIEKPGMKCIENDDAVSFVMLPLGSGTALSLTRINGREVDVEQRAWGEWMDIINKAGTERWRNDGDGYRQISP
jgi:hypothetical protein